jgi:hypothetical protein
LNKSREVKNYDEEEVKTSLMLFTHLWQFKITQRAALRWWLLSLIKIQSF